MICQIASVKPLSRFLRTCEVRPKCHSRVTVPCLHRLPAADDGVLGSFGTVLGYCQALFHQAKGPKEQTEHVISLLQGLPWSRSHELFYGYKEPEMEAGKFLEGALAPLQEEGRVPILITSLAPGGDDEEIQKIWTATRYHSTSETVLVRLLVGAENLKAAAEFFEALVKEGREKKEQPAFWPLFQPIGLFDGLDEAFGENWEYTCWATNPFTLDEMLVKLGEQVVVAQFPVGHADGVTEEEITIPFEMKISGATGGGYNLDSYLKKMAHLDSWPVMIILGPTLAQWSDEENRARVEAFTKLLLSKVEKYWDFVSKDRRKEVLKLTH